MAGELLAKLGDLPMGNVWLMLQDIRYGFRMLLKNPGVTAVAVIALALGIGANTAIFSVVDAVLLRPLPLEEPDRLVRMGETFPPSGLGSVSVLNWKDWREQNEAFHSIAAYQTESFNLVGAENPERVSGATVSAGFFQMLGVKPRLGRTFLEGEDQPGSSPVVVLSESLWRRNFGGDPSLVGKTIKLNSQGFTVAGIMPGEFRFPSPQTELWVPLIPTGAVAANRGSHYLLALGRLKHGVTLGQAQTQMDSIARRLEKQYPRSNAGRGVKLIPLREELVQNVRRALYVLLGAVGFLLLIACANVASLLLARASGRQREIAIRAALGAGRFRLIRQLLTESMLLAIAGGAMGVLVALWGVDVLVALAPGNLPQINRIRPDLPVLGFTLVVSVLTGLVFGLAPALRSSRPAVTQALRMSASSPLRLSASRLLVVAEISLTLVLLIGAGLLLKSFVRLERVDPGFRPQNVLTMKINLPKAKYSMPQSSVGFYQKVLERVRSLPGVQAAGIVTFLPLQDWGFNGDFAIVGRPPFPPNQQPIAEYRETSADYFRALSIPLIKGRYFTEQDAAGSPRAVIINEAMARRFFQDQDPIGQRLQFDSPDSVPIVGVVGNVKQATLARPAVLEIYVPYAQSPWLAFNSLLGMSLVVRASDDPGALTAAVRHEIRAVDLEQPVYRVKTMEQVIADSVSPRRFEMLLLGAFAGLAMVLATIGIYGVMFYSVRQRTQEIGIRMALGARQWDVLRMVVGEGAVLALTGVGIGVAAAFGLTRLLSSFLFGVGATDPATFAAALSVLLIAVALAASFIPARRATKVDPMLALRHE